MAATRERAGRPTQIHGVTLEERAVDASGQRLPWGYKWPEYAKASLNLIPANMAASDHPNARYQKSQPEEKGAFGKSSRRFGSSRATRTQTPAKKENPTIDGFEAALKFDASRRNEDVQPARSQQTTDTAAAPPPSSAVVVKEPLQVMLYGFSPDFQYAAIDFYERVSSGIICEDYSRDPPASQRRYYTSGAVSNGSIPRRSLTPAELALSSQYHGGKSWIVVTFDSHESGDRAVASSPHVIAGHWVYAEPYRGTGPTEDRPIPQTERDRPNDAPNSLSALRPPPKSATLGSASGATALVRRESASKQKQPLTLPRSYAAPATQTFQEDDDEDPFLEAASLESATASSATALPASESPEAQQQLRLRNAPANAPQSSTLTPSPQGSGSSTTLLSYPSLPGQPTNNNRNTATTSSISPPQSTSKSAAESSTFTHFPSVPRTVIKPANEALLPQVTWWEGTIKSLRKQGWIPGDMIGGEVPRKEDGSFDWDKASLYWRVWALVDWMFGTEFCGLEGEAAGGLEAEGEEKGKKIVKE